MSPANKTANEQAGFHPFRFDDGSEYGSFEVFWDDSDIPEHGTEPRNFDANGEPVQPGWYWWACFPGCMPDGDASGPFNTSTEAHDNALENA